MPLESRARPLLPASQHPFRSSGKYRANCTPSPRQCATREARRPLPARHLSLAVTARRRVTWQRHVAAVPADRQIDQIPHYRMVVGFGLHILRNGSLPFYLYNPLYKTPFSASDKKWTPSNTGLLRQVNSNRIRSLNNITSKHFLGSSEVCLLRIND